MLRFAKRQTSDDDLNKVQDALVSTLNPVFSAQILDGVLLSNVSLTSGSNTINNPLMRNVQGVIPVMKSAACDVYVTSNGAKTLTLTATAACTASLWIF